jgi:alpha-mannosidase
VSIDQVHEKMEFSYRQVFEAMQADIQKSLAFILADFAPGLYAVSTNPFPYTGWQVFDGSLHPVVTQGVGTWRVGESLPVKKPGTRVDAFEWKNRYYAAQVQAGGVVEVGAATLGGLLVFEELGDTYSDERGRFLGELQPGGPLLVEQQSEHHCVLRSDCSAAWGQLQVSAVLRLTFDQSPLIRWQVDLNSHGTDFRVEMDFDTAQPGQVYAGMPFDVVRRAPIDNDLLPRSLDKKMESVLLGQRELGATRSFPFHDFVAVSDSSHSAVVLAKGLHAYQADEKGHITIIPPGGRMVTAHRRQGRCRLFFYVPDAR